MFFEVWSEFLFRVRVRIVMSISRFVELFKSVV